MSQLLPGSIIEIIGRYSRIASVILLAKILEYRVHHFRGEDEPSIFLANNEVVAHY